VQIKSLIVASVLLTSFIATPLRVQAEDRVVPPTVVSKVYPSKEERAAKLAERLALQKAARLAAKAAKPPVAPVLSRLEILHKRMIAKDELTASEMQELADSGDGLAAFYYARKLEESGRTSALPSAVHYYAMASYLGREFAMSRMIALMKSPEVTLSDKQIKSGKDALVKLARAGNIAAALGLADMYVIGQPFAQDTAESRKWLMQAAKAGDANAAQKLAQAAIMPQDGSAPDVPAARAALALMIASNEPGKVAMAQTLLARLDATDPLEVSQ
jgi:TPR repeat protein